MISDLRFALRLFRSHLGFTAIAVSTIALAIGANTTVFTVVNAVLLRPLPYQDPGRLIFVSEKAPGTAGLDGVSSATAHDLVERSRTLESIEAYRDMSTNLVENGEPEVLRGQIVSAGFFDTLGTKAMLGRTFEANDALPANNEVVLLSESLWRRRFGADPAIVGRTLTMNERPIRVIGVLPPSFHPLRMSNPGETPHIFRTLVEDAEDRTDRTGRAYKIARLYSHVTVAEARAELDTVYRQLVREHPADFARDAQLTVAPLRDHLTQHIRTALWMLFAAVAFVFLIAAVNVANLQLSRATARSPEMALRTALGGSRARLIRQLLVENLLLALIGGAFGVLIAWHGTIALVALAPSEIPRLSEVHLDTSVLLFALGASIAAGLLSGIAPALRASRIGLNPALRSRGATGSRLRSALVIAEIACAFVLATGTGLLVRSYRQILRVDAGYDARNILTMTATVYGPQAPNWLLQHYCDFLQRVRAIPGVQSAGLGSSVPLSQPVQDRACRESEAISPQVPLVDRYFISPGYMETLRMAVKQGRAFTEQDAFNGPRVAVVSESFARAQFPGVSAIGQRIRLGYDEPGTPLATIVGVVGDVWQHGVDEGPSAGVYLAQSQNPSFYYRLLVRTAGDPWSVLPTIRAALHEIAPRQPIYHIQPMETYVTNSLADRIFTLALIGLLGMLALLLAAIGIYGVVAYAVSLRTRELGIRMALGADRANIFALVLRDILTSLAGGLAIGIVSSLALTRLMTHLLYRVEPTDPATTLAAALALTAVALAAGCIPCRRALQMDPASALRCE